MKHDYFRWLTEFVSLKKSKDVVNVVNVGNVGNVVKVVNVVNVVTVVIVVKVLILLIWWLGVTPPSPAVLPDQPCGW